VLDSHFEHCLGSYTWKCFVLFWCAVRFSDLKRFHLLSFELIKVLLVRNLSLHASWDFDISSHLSKKSHPSNETAKGLNISSFTDLGSLSFFLDFDRFAIKMEKLIFHHHLTLFVILSYLTHSWSLRWDYHPKLESLIPTKLLHVGTASHNDYSLVCKV